MKKLLWRAAIASGTVGAILAGAAAFSAFEAHVVNVTATIENALDVPVSALKFGTVFPEEWLHQFVSIGMSQSFQDERNVDEVDYHIRQKPKCQLNEQAEGEPFAQVTDGENGSFVCPEGYHPMPLLCPFLSKHPDNQPENDGSLDAFHGPIDLASWTQEVAKEFEVDGKLVKETDPTDNWDIDLHAPCFKGQCAQDNVVPEAYQLDPSLNHASFGCDLWFEVTNVNRPPT